MLKKFILFTLFSINIILLLAQTSNQYIKAGDKAMIRQDYISAINYYTSALNQGADELEYSFKLANAYRLFHNYTEAEKWYRNTLENDNDNKFPLTNFWLAMVLKNQMRYEEAEGFISKFIQNASDIDKYYKDKAEVELIAIKESRKIINEPVNFEVTKLPVTINSKFSEFSPFPVTENKIYFSSLRYLTRSNVAEGEKFYISKILTSEKTKDWSRPKLMTSGINNENEHNSNAVISKSGEYLFFTRCNPGYPADIKCKIYFSKYKNGRWQKAVELPGKINLDNYTTTQPSISETNEGIIIYFISDRPGGIGMLDIWFTVMDSQNNFTDPQNAGTIINTPGNEASPFYNDSTQTLYFSSDYHKGIGGYDIFSGSGNKTSWSEVINLGYPLNSSYDDLYYITTSENNLSGFLTSNRLGSELLSKDACCFDIYSFSNILITDTISKQDSLISSKENTTDTINNNLLPETKEGLQSLKSFLPLKLYFHNDEPDTKTLAVTTRKTYDQTFNEYIRRKEEYRKKFTENLSGNATIQADALILRFFEEEVEHGMQKLNEFAEILLQRLNDGDSFTLKFKGYTSPLATTDYNKNLAHRRISSLMNYFKEFKNGSFNKFMNADNAKLILVEEPIGELFSPQNVSDDLADKRKSVYSPEAAAERRIEIIAIDINE